jgi:hypothetical protein
MASPIAGSWDRAGHAGRILPRPARSAVAASGHGSADLRHIDLAPAGGFGNSPPTAREKPMPRIPPSALRHHGLPRRRAFRRLLGPVLDSAAPAGAPRLRGQLGECRALQRGQPGAAAFPLSAPPATPARSRAARRHRNPVGPGLCALEQFADLWRRRPGDAAVLSDARLVDDFRARFSCAIPSGRCGCCRSCSASPAHAWC